MTDRARVLDGELKDTGGLWETLSVLLDAGHSWRAVERILFARTGVEVSHETLRGWWANRTETK